MNAQRTALIGALWLLTVAAAFVAGKSLSHPAAQPGDTTTPPASRQEPLPASSSPASEPVGIALGQPDRSRALFDFSQFIAHADEATLRTTLRDLNRHPRSVRRDEMTALLYRRWGALAPLNALDNVSTLNRSERERLEKSILTGWAQTNTAAVSAWISQQGGPISINNAERRFRDTIDALLENDGFSSVAELIRGIRGVPGVSEADNHLQQIAAARLAAAWMSHDPKAAAEWINGIPGGLVRTVARNAAIQKMAAEEPEVATQFALALADEGARSTALSSAISGWLMEGDAKTAQAWLLAQPKSAALDAAIDTYVRSMAQNTVVGGAPELIDSMLDPTRRASVVNRTIGLLKTNSPALATMWTGRFLSGQERLNTYNEIVSRWADRRPAEAQASVAAQTWLTESERQTLLTSLQRK